jgi:predicted transcriptional regulator of viral defense system
MISNNCGRHLNRSIILVTYHIMISNVYFKAAKIVNSHPKNVGSIVRTLPAAPSLPSGRTSISRWIQTLQSHGFQDFSVDEAHRALGGTLQRVRLGLSRLAAKGVLVRPAKGLYIIVAPEHRTLGAPPPLWYVDNLMERLGLPYYVGILSAAALHGASSQAPQELQVVTTTQRTVKVVGRGRIRWVVKQHLAKSATQDMATPTGKVHVSTPETTALDLVRYARHAGYLDNVTAVLADLAEKLNLDRLVQAAGTDLSTARRLGYLLGVAGHGVLAADFRERLPLRRGRPVRLDVNALAATGGVDPLWHLIINTSVDPN